MGRNNNPTRGSTIRHVVRTIAAASTAVATLAAGMLVAGTANATAMRDITPTRFPGLSMSFLNRWTPMQTSRIMNANPVSRKKPVPGFSGGGEGPFDQRSVHDIVLGMQPVLVECQRDDVGQGCKYGGFLFYGDLSDHVPDSSERSVPPRRRSRPR